MAGYNDVWGTRLKEARVSAGLSQKQLGIQAGLDPSVASTRINRYELGIHKADFQIAQHLAKVLQVPTAYLYAEDDELAKWILAFQAATPLERQRFLSSLEQSSPQQNEDAGPLDPF